MYMCYLHWGSLAMVHFHHVFLQLLGYARRTESGWSFSPDAEMLLKQYMERYIFKSTVCYVLVELIIC